MGDSDKINRAMDRAILGVSTKGVNTMTLEELRAEVLELREYKREYPCRVREMELQVDQLTTEAAEEHERAQRSKRDALLLAGDYDGAAKVSMVPPAGTSNRGHVRVVFDLEGETVEWCATGELSTLVWEGES